ncbi:MAG: metallophosphoesterase family protein [Candidatus Hodarchaeales archaeon]|jgi:putative phosphoesterase
MKVIGLISDTHLPSRRKSLPKDVIKAFQNAKVDLIIHAGDLENLSIIPLLEEIAPVTAVQGNMCHQEVKKRFLKKEIIRVEELSIGITHGSGGPSGYYERVVDMFKDETSLPNIIISGHTHQPEAKMVNGIQIINPGSPTDKIFAPRNTVAILEIKGKEFQYRFIEIK